MSERVMIFIDAANFHYALKYVIKNTKISYQKLQEMLTEERKLVRTYFYTVMVEKQNNEQNYRDQQRFLTALDYIPYLEKKFGRLVKRSGVHVEKGVDVLIAVDMLTMALRDNYDTAILVSGDGDFVSVIEAVKALGKHVEVAFPSHKAYHLRSKCDKFTLLTHEKLKDCFC